MAWKKGPLPPKTYGFGGVVTKDLLKTGISGFFFADFRGDHVIIPDIGIDGKSVAADEVAAYDNSMTIPKFKHNSELIED